MDREYGVEVESQYDAKMMEVEIAPDCTSEGETNDDIEDVQEMNKIIDPYKVVHMGERRKVVRAKIVNNHDGSVKRVKLTLAAQRRHKRNEPWQDSAEFNLTNLKGGEEARISLDAAETFELFQTLKDFYAISKWGEPSGQRRVYYVQRDGNGHNFPIQKLLSLFAEGGEEVWKQIAKSKPNIPLALALHKIHAVRADAVAEFERHMNDGDWDEGEWQKFFAKNTWIFGHGLAYHVLDTVQEQVHYGGRTLSGRGGQRGDYLMATRAAIKFTVLVEIKRPDTALLNNEEYRNKVYRISDELAGGVAQVQSNCRTWVLDGSRQEENREALEDDDIFTYEPKGILVVGNTAELAANRNKRASFELYRRNLMSPEVLTFDELLARAKFLIAHEEEKQAAEGEANAEST